MNAAFLNNERLADLLVKQTTEGLLRTEKEELDQLLARHRDADPELVERVAAAVALAGEFDEEALPAALRERVEIEGRRLVAAKPATVSEIRPPRRDEQPLRSSVSQWTRMALAASVLLAVVGWWPRLRDTVSPATGPQVATTEEPAPIAEPPPAPSAAEKRQMLLASGKAVQSPWTATGDPLAPTVAGDVVWDNESQTGFLRLSGLTANDPGQSQYQLWIFDATRDDRYPIDGGVFDVPAGQSEIVIPIQARLGVNAPAMFAVTIEKPGGVVVSEREHVVALAKVAAS
jgi:hypothetical protein